MGNPLIPMCSRLFYLSGILFSLRFFPQIFQGYFGGFNDKSREANVSSANGLFYLINYFIRKTNGF